MWGQPNSAKKQSCEMLFSNICSMHRRNIFIVYLVGDIGMHCCMLKAGFFKLSFVVGGVVVAAVSELLLLGY